MAKVKLGGGSPSESEKVQASKILLDATDAARELGVSTAQLERLIARGSLAASKVGDAWKVEPAELVRFVKTSPSAESMRRPTELPTDLRVVKAAEGVLRRTASAATSDRAILHELDAAGRRRPVLDETGEAMIDFGAAPPPGFREEIAPQLDGLAEVMLGRALVAEARDRFGRMLADPLAELYRSPAQYRDLVAAATRRALAVVFVARELRTVAEEVGRVLVGDSIEVKLRKYQVRTSYTLNASSVLLASRLQAAAQRVL